MSEIGLLAEQSLHAALKEWASRPGDRIEAEVDGFVVDLVRDDTLIEIQTGNFTALKGKLAVLLEQHHVHLIHPIAEDKWIVKVTEDGERVGRRKSPKHGRVEDVFYELVRIPHLLPHPNLSLEVVLTHEEVVWRDDGRGSWRRRGWSIADRRLLEVVEQARFASVAALCGLLPAGLPTPFTNKELAEALGCRDRLAQKMTYTLRKAGGLTLVGKRGRSNLHEPV